MRRVQCGRAVSARWHVVRRSHRVRGYVNCARRRARRYDCWRCSTPRCQTASRTFSGRSWRGRWLGNWGCVVLMPLPMVSSRWRPWSHAHSTPGVFLPGFTVAHAGAARVGLPQHGHVSPVSSAATRRAVGRCGRSSERDDDQPRLTGRRSSRVRSSSMTTVWRSRDEAGRPSLLVSSGWNARDAVAWLDGTNG